MIRLSNVSKGFATKDGVLQVLSGVSYSFERGFYGISGKSGAGKTTIISLIGMIDAPTSGTIEVDGNVIDEYNVREFRGKYISFVFQKESLLRGYTVYDNLKLVCDDEKKIDETLKRIRLSDAKHAYVGELSGGEKQRVSFARTLLEDRPVILLDEPTGNLDKKNARIIMDILKEESARKLVVMVSHDTGLLDEYSDVRLAIEDKNISVLRGASPKPSSHGAVQKRTVDKRLLLKRESMFRPLSAIAAFFASMIMALFIAVSSSSVFYSVRGGAKNNADIGDLIMPCLNYFSIQNATGGESMNESIKSSLSADKYRECFLVDNMPVLFEDESLIGQNEIIIPDLYATENYSAGDVLSFAGSSYIVSGKTDDYCFYISSANKQVIQDYKARFVSFPDSKGEGEGNGLTIFNGSIRFGSSGGVRIAPASEIGAELADRQAIFRNRSLVGQSFAYLGGMGLDRRFFETCLDMRELFPRGIDYVAASDLGIGADSVDDYAFYVSDGVYAQAKDRISKMDLSQFVLINDNSSVIDFILDNGYGICSLAVGSEGVMRLEYYLMNANSDSGIFFMKGLSDTVFFAFSIGYVLFVSIAVVNTAKERKYVLGVLDIAGCSRWFSVAAINIKTIISSSICGLACIVLGIGGWAISFVNDIVMDLGFSANFLYISIPSIVVSTITLFVAPALGMAISLLRLRKMPTKRIFESEE